MIRDLEQAELTGNPDIEIENIEYDSRLLKANSLFIAIKGFQRDGYDFLEQARSQGAVAVMADVAARFYGFPGMNIKVCGVTGTNGKTTTCYLIKAILEARSKTTGLVTSSVYDTGKEIFEAERTTPESLDMQRLLFLMKKNHCVNAVIEVSSHALALNRVDNIDFRVAVYTNLTRDHLDFHHTMEEYFEAKAQLVKRLDGPLSYAVINLDVPEFRKLFGDFTSSFMTYSLDNRSADIYLDKYEIEHGKSIFDMVTPVGKATVSLPLPGRFNLMNALAAAAGGLASGIDLDSVVRGLESVRSVPGRFDYVDNGQPFAVYVDYAHTPDAIERLCQAAREITTGKIYLLFGCGGDRDKGKRPLMGQAATIGADFAVVSSDNPRGEEPLDIIEDIKPGLEGKNYEIIPDRLEAIAAVLKMASPGDAVLLAGKGAENYQEIKGVRYPFDDTAEARKVLRELGYTQTGMERES